MPRPRSLLAIVAAIVFVLAYIALLGWFFRSAPSQSEAEVQEYVAEVLMRPGRPIEPLPMVRVPLAVDDGGQLTGDSTLIALLGDIRPAGRGDPHPAWSRLSTVLSWLGAIGLVIFAGRRSERRA